MMNAKTRSRFKHLTPNELLAFYKRKGDEFSWAGEYSRARTMYLGYLEAAKSLGTEASCFLESVKAKIDLAITDMLQGHYTSSVESLADLEKKLDEEQQNLDSDDLEEAESLKKVALLNQAVTYLYMLDSNRLRKVLRRLTKLYDKNNLEELNECLSLKAYEATSLMFEGKLSKAEESFASIDGQYGKALAKLEKEQKLDDDLAEAKDSLLRGRLRTRENIGGLLIIRNKEKRREILKGIDYLEALLPEIESVEDMECLAEAKLDIALGYNLIGNFDKADEFCTESLKIARERFELTTLLDYALKKEIYRKQGKDVSYVTKKYRQFIVFLPYPQRELAERKAELYNLSI